MTASVTALSTRRLRGLYCAWVAIVLVAVCATLFGTTESPTQRPIAQWNLIVYMAADNSLDPFAAADLRKMAKIGSTAKVNVIVEVARSKDRDPSWTGDRRFRLTKDHPFGGAQTTMLGEINTGDPASLVDFVHWAYTHYPARRNALVIWNHGSGWREAQIQQPKSSADAPSNKVFKAIAFDERTGDRLYQVQLESALHQLKQRNVHLDLIGFDACLMSMLEVWYGLKDIATIGVGSEDLEPGYGWPYDELLRKLTITPNISADLLGPLIVDTYARSITDSSSPARKKDAFTLAAIRLSGIPQVATTLHTLSAAMGGDENSQSISKARAKTHAFAFDPKQAWPNGVDLAAFAQEEASESQSPAVRSAAASLQKAVNDAVLETRFSDNRRDYHPNGISIYFPESAGVWARDPEGKAYTKENQRFAPAFVRENSWPTFLSAYYKQGDPSKRSIVKKAESTMASLRGLDSPPLDGCLKGSLNVEQQNHRFDVIRKHYDVVLPVEWQEAVMAVVRRYCEARPGESKTNDAELERLVSSTDVAHPELLYTALRIICENDDDVPSGLDLRDAFLQYLAVFHHDTLEDLAERLFRGDVDSASDKLPGFAAKALFLDTAFEINRRIRSSTENAAPPEFSEADSIRLLLAARSYFDLALDQFSDQFQRRLAYQEDVYQPPIGAYRAYRFFKARCSQLDRAVTSQDTQGSAFSATKSDCLFYGTVLAFVTHQPQEVRVSSELWLSRFRNGLARLIVDMDLWRMQWYNGWAIGETSPKQALALFDRAFQTLLTTHLPDVRREDVREWSSVFPNASLATDQEPAFRAPSLFFAQWHKVTMNAKVDTAEELRVIEYGRLFDGSSPLTTAFFGSEDALKKQLAARFGLRPEDNKDLTSFRKNFADRIRTEDLHPKPTTLIYFTNIWDGFLYVYCVTHSGTTREKTKMSIMGASLMQIDHSTQTKWASSTFIKPIWKELLSSLGQTLNIVPQSYAATVPFAALKGSDGKFLIDNFAIVFHTTLVGVTDAGAAELKRDSKLTIVHSPVTADEKLFPPLPGAEQEADGIVSALRILPISIVTLDHQRATKSSVEMAAGDSSWLHVISHGYALASDPLSSGIVLTPADGNDGLLTIADMMKWTHTMDVIMLASCDSGRMRNEGAFLAGVSSLPRLGIARTVGLSLWPLNDASGSLLMREFYERLALGMPPPVALRKAQLEVRKAYDDPDFWSPVVLYSELHF